MLLLTVPPFRIVSVPVPELPTERSPELVEDEPTPSTVTVPVEPVLMPRLAVFDVAHLAAVPDRQRAGAT